MDRRKVLAGLGAGAALLLGDISAALAEVPRFTFPSIDGGDLDSGEWRGRPVLVVNTASLCGFSGQMRDMQRLHETYGPRGLVVLAVPSNDFRQELETGAEVRDYCLMEYGLDLPMTDILPVARGQVHPFYSWVRQETGFVPQWNFGKVLLDPEGRVAGTWNAFTRPGAREITARFTPWLRG